MDEPDPTPEMMIADGFTMAAAAMIRQATALEALAGAIETVSDQLNEVIATLNGTLDVSIASEPLEPVAVNGVAMVPELHIQITSAAQIPMVLEAWRKANEEDTP